MVLQIQNLHLSHQDKVLFRDFNLQVQPGEKVALTGRSGAGKSSLFKAILGLIAPDEGSVVIQGHTLSPATAHDIRTRIAWVPQEPQLPDETVQKTLERSLRFKANRHLMHRLEEAPKLLEALGLPKATLQQKTQTLSGGEKQRIALLRAVLLQRDLFLMDEPLSALDRESRDCILAFILNLPAAVLAILHSPEDAAAFKREVRVVEDTPC